jgi:hypothetical protein
MNTTFWSEISKAKDNLEALGIVGGRLKLEWT